MIPHIHHLGAVLCGVVLSGIIARADTLMLNDGISRITGNVDAIGNDGIVRFTSEVAKQPLEFDFANVSSIQINNTNRTHDPASQEIELIGGNFINAVITDMDPDTLRTNSGTTGDLTIPLHAIVSVKFNPVASRPIYRGPNSMQEWTSDLANRQNWSFQDNTLICHGPATASLRTPIPDNFIFAFHLQWEDSQAPNYTIALTDSLSATSSDRYAFVLDCAGVRIERESQRKRTVLAQISRFAEETPHKSMLVELRFDRSKSKFQLYIDSHLECSFIDPTGPPPPINGISIKCEPAANSNQLIRSIKILKYDPFPEIPTAREGQKPKPDLLISSRDERWIGKLLAMFTRDGRSYCRFQPISRQEPIELPTTEIHSMYFPGRGMPGLNPPFIIHTIDGNILLAIDCATSATAFTFHHPFLGTLTLQRDQIIEIKRRPPTNR